LAEGQFTNRAKEGIWTNWNQDGSIILQVEYKKGLKVRTIKEYKPDPNKKSKSDNNGAPTF
jgi:antitoxin component YwqK of YwqJK toxin-antitoxin module